MLRYSKVINEQTKQCEVADYETYTEKQKKYFENLGMTLQDVDKSYNGDWYLINYMPKEPLNILKDKKKKELNQARDKTEQGGFEYMGKIFDSDLISCVRIQGAAQLAAQMPMSDTPIIEWTCKDNTHIKLTPAELIGLSAALANWSNECHKKASELKQQVDDAQTEEELNAIKW